MVFEGRAMDRPLIEHVESVHGLPVWDTETFDELKRRHDRDHRVGLEPGKGPWTPWQHDVDDHYTYREEES